MRNLPQLLLICALAAGTACASRTTAATRPSPTVFDVTASDATAVEKVDAMLAALGGAEVWDKAKQVRWETKYTFDGELKAWFKHSWDRWNGRHRFETAAMDTYKASLTDKDVEVKFSVGMYDLFSDARGSASYGGRRIEESAQIKRIVKMARERWAMDTYQVFMIYKLKEPGVKLTADGELVDMQGFCKPACDSVKVTFSEDTGTDVYYVHINRETKLPEIIEKLGEQGRIGHHLSDWTDAGGLKFPGKIQNIGLKGEVFTVSGYKVGSPSDSLYIPQVR